MLRDAEEQVERQLGVVVEDRNAAQRIKRADAPTGNQVDIALGELPLQRRGGFGRGRYGRIDRNHERDLTGVADPACGQLVMQQQRAFARRGRAFERCAAHADDRVPLGEGWDDPGEPLGAATE